jgi:hypothetical protein
MKVSSYIKSELSQSPIYTNVVADKITKNGHVFIVSEGSPQDDQGDYISRLAIASFFDFFENDVLENIYLGIQTSFQFTNDQLYRHAVFINSLNEVYASLSLVLVRPEGIYVGHIGNTRVYYKS